MKTKLIITILIIFTLPMYILITPVYAFEPSSDTIYEGIDVSGWQGRIDYEQVKNNGIEIIYMKSSEGSNFVDPYFNENYTNAKANGLKVCITTIGTIAVFALIIRYTNVYIAIESIAAVIILLIVKYFWFFDFIGLVYLILPSSNNGLIMLLET